MNFTKIQSCPARQGRIRVSLFALLSGIVCVLACAPKAQALPTYPSVVLSVYHPKTAVENAAKACVLCHAGAPPKLNPYGGDVRIALKEAHTKVLTSAILQAVETKDSDGDGFANAAELAADTLPGDPASKPAGTPPVASASKPTSSAPKATEAEPGLFAPKTLFFPKHGQHPVLVHFPIALFMISVFFDLIGLWKRNAALVAAAYFNLVVAAVSAPLAVVTGLVAWQFAYGGAPLTGILLYHLLLGSLTACLLNLLWWLRARQSKNGGQPLSRTYAALCGLTVAIITITGHLGGALVGGG